MLRQIFGTEPIAKISITAENLRKANSEHARTGRGNVRLIECTFDLKWTGRSRFDFAENMTSASDKQVGVIVFSADVNAALEVTQHACCSGILTFAERWAGALGLDSGISLGCTFRGRYRSPGGGVYEEQSLTMQLSDMTKHDLIKLAISLVQEFELSSVLVKHAATGKIYLVTSS